MQKKDLKEELIPCGCGRSPTGYCMGLHEMTEEQYEEYLLRDGFEDSNEG